MIMTAPRNLKSSSPSCAELRCSATVAMSETSTEVMVAASAWYRAAAPTACAMHQRTTFSKR